MTQRTIVILSFILFVTALLWGGYGLMIYLGVPIHQYVFSTQDEVSMWDLACGKAATSGVYLCRGAAVFFPFLMNTLQMASPLYGYIVVSALLLLGVLLYQGYKTGYFSLRTHWRPLTLILLFAGSVWLLGTTFSLGSLYNMRTPQHQMITDVNGTRILPPFRRFFEPTQEVYGGAGSQALAELQANYQDLLTSGCLGDTGVKTQNGAKLFNLSFWCTQGSLFSRVGTQFVMVIFFLFNLLVLGRFLLVTVLRLRQVQPFLLFGLSLGVGALGLVAILWSLGVLGLLQSTIVRIVFFGLPFALYPHSRWWLRQSMDRKFDVDLSFKNWHLYASWLLITYLSLNFLNVVRPFPIGWDDLGSYLNRPRLLASYGTFIPSMSQFQWEYLTSLGFLLFGYDSWIGSTFAMQINWVAGLIAVLSVYLLGRLYFGKKGGVIAAMCYYFLPMAGHFSFADMKIDNASFFTTALAVSATLAYFFRTADEYGEKEAPAVADWRLIVAAGLLAGFSFAIKPTAVLGMLMIFSLLSGAALGGWALAGAIFVGFAVLQQFGALNIVDISQRALVGFVPPRTLFTLATLALGLGGIGYAMFRNRSGIVPYLRLVGCLALGVAVATVPWMIRNGATADYITTNTLLSAQDKDAVMIEYGQKADVDAMNLPAGQPVRHLPPELALDRDNPVCHTSARTEELDRYWGFDKGISHYLTLGWRQVMNTDTFGYYVTFAPMLLLFPLLLLLPAFWFRRHKWLQLLFVATFIFFVQWSLVGNGIAWYGIGMFLGLAIGMEAFIALAPDSQNRWLFSFFIAMSLLICITNRLWQFDSQKNIFEYPLGKISASALREVTIPDYDDIRGIVVDRHESIEGMPYTYRIGTFISYFIPRNREIFPLADHQLNFFSCLNQEQDHALTVKRLQALGFNSIIFDTNTHTIEKDPNGSLHQKVGRFLDFANDPASRLNVVVNDPDNGIAFLLLPTDTGTGAVLPQ